MYGYSLDHTGSAFKRFAGFNNMRFLLFVLKKKDSGNTFIMHIIRRIIFMN